MANSTSRPNWLYDTEFNWMKSWNCWPGLTHWLSQATQGVPRPVLCIVLFSWHHFIELPNVTYYTILIYRGQHDKRSKVFRQKFAHIGEFRSVCPEAVYIAMTATATKATETAACNILQMVDYKSIRESPEKLNLRFVPELEFYCKQNREENWTQCWPAWKSKAYSLFKTILFH